MYILFCINDDIYGDRGLDDAETVHESLWQAENYAKTMFPCDSYQILDTEIFECHYYDGNFNLVKTTKLNIIP